MIATEKSIQSEEIRYSISSNWLRWEYYKGFKKEEAGLLGTKKKELFIDKRASERLHLSQPSLRSYSFLINSQIISGYVKSLYV